MVRIGGAASVVRIGGAASAVHIGGAASVVLIGGTQLLGYLLWYSKSVALVLF